MFSSNLVSEENSEFYLVNLLKSSYIWKAACCTDEELPVVEQIVGKIYWIIFVERAGQTLFQIFGGTLVRCSLRRVVSVIVLVIGNFAVSTTPN
jgi:hypothetical protein